MPDSLLSDSLLADSPLALIDHHVHGVVAGPLDGPGIESMLTEAALPRAAGHHHVGHPARLRGPPLVRAGARPGAVRARPPSTWRGAPSSARPR